MPQQTMILTRNIMLEKTSDIVFFITPLPFYEVVQPKKVKPYKPYGVGESRDDIIKKAPANLSWGLYINK